MPQHFLRNFPPQKTQVAQMHRTISCQELLPPTGWHLILFHHPQRVYGRTEYACVTTKISRMDSLPNYLSYGALLTRSRGAPLKGNSEIIDKFVSSSSVQKTQPFTKWDVGEKLMILVILGLCLMIWRYEPRNCPVERTWSWASWIVILTC